MIVGIKLLHDIYYIPIYQGPYILKVRENGGFERDLYLLGSGS